MRPLRKIASELLGFDRRERRATYILAVILVFLLLIRIFIPGKRAEGDKIVVIPSGGLSKAVKNNREPAALFLFDPNTADEETLLQLGFSERQAATLMNYRKAGARFRKSSDIYRVYGIDSAFASVLIPWIDIPTEGVTASSGSKVHAAEIVLAEEETNRGEAGMEASVKPSAVMDLNKCVAEDLEQLPGIGKVLSARIIKYRELLGGYVSSSQLREVYGVDSATVVMISSRLKASGDDIRHIHLDTCSWAQMARHPYLGPETARAIMKYRSLMGLSFTVDDLVRQRVISDSQAERIAPYVSSSGMGSDD
ncbi:MAG TPA: helix-hairpin-helix domain-containing protein [Bacteroidales bacterium]|nr:helix-hairpin-helix domain-containing protein [Bacteroidales bacterium]